MDIRIRRAELDDIDSLVGFDHVAQRDPARVEFIRSAIRARRCSVAVAGDDITGFLIVRDHFFGHEFIDLVYVAPDRRRLGVGDALVAHAEAACSGNKLFTSTNLSNKPMQTLLAKRGYVLSGYLDNLDEGDPELVYVKSG